MRPLILQGKAGALAATYFPPTGPLVRGSFLVAAAFAEEMNRCRSMVALQARALSQSGYGTLVVDPFGTGDSEGNFEQATWDVWRDDLRVGLSWLLAACPGPCTAWGVRLGALLAADLAVDSAAIKRILLWQPVVSGRQFLTNLMRVRIAAEMHESAGVKSTDELKAHWVANKAVELSGYEVGPQLAHAVDALDLAKFALPAGVATSWFEVLPSTESVVPRTSTKIVEAWQSAGCAVEFRRVVGAPFWQVHERELVPDLVEATCAGVSAWRDESSYPIRDAAPADCSAVGAAEQPLVFPCEQDELAGVLHRPSGRHSGKGIVIVVAGGPQYRVGAHRQFVALARKLAKRGHTVLRFDLRGMGDSSGHYQGFQSASDDLRAAVDELVARDPGLRDIVLFGECESASGILFYAWRDVRVKGIALVNPWVRTVEGQARVIVKHYYAERLRSRELWSKVFSGQFDWRGSFASAYQVVAAYRRGRKAFSRSGAPDVEEEFDNLPLPDKTAAGLRHFAGPALLLMSGHDYIAREFDEVTSASPAWAGLLSRPGLRRHDVAGADHTFSRAAWKSEASSTVADWLDNW